MYSPSVTHLSNTVISTFHPPLKLCPNFMLVTFKVELIISTIRSFQLRNLNSEWVLERRTRVYRKSLIPLCCYLLTHCDLEQKVSFNLSPCSRSNISENRSLVPVLHFNTQTRETTYFSCRRVAISMSLNPLNPSTCVSMLQNSYKASRGMCFEHTHDVFRLSIH